MQEDSGRYPARGEEIEVDPFRCRMWALHDRLEDYVSESTCRSEIESVLKYGQRLPVLGRSLHGDAEHDVELIYGARRLFVCRHLNRPLKVIVREVSDRDALVAMDIENRMRQDISPYERGMSYARWLRAGHFESQEEIARSLQVSSSQVSRLLRIARLPSIIVSAFSSPMEICEGWGLDLADAWQDESRRPLLRRRAQEILVKSPRPSAREVIELLTIPPGRKRGASRSRRDDVVLGKNGEPLFRIRRQRKAFVLMLPIEGTSVKILEQISSSVADILLRAKAQAADKKGNFPREQRGLRRRNNLANSAVLS